MDAPLGRIRFISLVATGTKADLQPYLALASGIRHAGFIVRIVTHKIHCDDVLSSGFEFFPLKGDPSFVLRSTAFREGVLEGSMFRIASLFKAETDNNVEPNMRLIFEGCKSADAILCNVACLTECMAIAQKKQIPLLLCPQLPFSPSGEVRLTRGGDS